MPENISIRKLEGLNFLAAFIACIFTAGITWGTITYGSESRDKKVEDQEQRIRTVEKAIVSVKISLSAMENEQKNQGKDIAQTVRLLDRIADKIQ